LDNQVVRAALKTYTRFKTDPDIELSPSSRYLRTLNVALPTRFSWTDPPSLVLLLELRAAHTVSNYPGEEADAGAAHRLSMAVADAFVVSKVSEMFELLKGWGDSRTREVMRKVLLLYLLITVETGLSDIVLLGVTKAWTISDARWAEELRSEISKLCISILPERIGLTDAFGFSDWELDSALGVYDGKVYERLWERAQENPLNRLDVNEIHGKYLGPVLERGRHQAMLGQRSKL